MNESRTIVFLVGAGVGAFACVAALTWLGRQAHTVLNGHVSPPSAPTAAPHKLQHWEPGVLVLRRP